MSLESPSTRTEQIASNLLAHGRVLSVEEIIGKLDAVDTDAVRRFGERIMNCESPAIAAVGPVGKLESHETFAARFGAGSARRAAE
jgi:predicted Zn-dependent peptidase